MEECPSCGQEYNGDGEELCRLCIAVTRASKAAVAAIFVRTGMMMLDELFTLPGTQSAYERAVRSALNPDEGGN